ncbi:MAG: ATP-binding protein, partial [Lachnospiraceae bacterium]|nr:ATP-binding protein [Lachnospiraceae bacterium]
ELLCRDHIKQIKKKLDIYGVYAEESIWYAKPEEINGIEKRGAQIDLLIERRDRVINLCEIKFSLHEFEIDKSYDDSLRNKIERFRQAIGPRDTIALTMITTFGVKNNKYSGLVSNQVILDNLFAQI